MITETDHKISRVGEAETASLVLFENALPHRSTLEARTSSPGSLFLFFFLSSIADDFWSSAAHNQLRLEIHGPTGGTVIETSGSVQARSGVCPATPVCGYPDVQNRMQRCDLLLSRLQKFTRLDKTLKIVLRSIEIRTEPQVAK